MPIARRDRGRRGRLCLRSPRSCRVGLVSTASAAATRGATALTGLNAGAVKVKPGEQMLVESDQLVYDYDNNTVSAVGNVKIYYGGYTLEAEKVTYIKPTGRLIATGNVKLVDPTGDGRLCRADLDITDDFRDGFVKSLRVDTPDKTYFAAERAERDGRRDDDASCNGVYTACEPCKDHPEKPPLWQVQAAKIIINHKEKMIYFHNARARVPRRADRLACPTSRRADPSVKRKTGFLRPSSAIRRRLGCSAGLALFLGARAELRHDA